MAEKEKVAPELLRKFYENYLLLRLTEERLVDIYYAGKVPGHIHSGIGEEALQAVMLELMEDDDYYSGHHRPVSGGLVLGIDLKTFFCEIMGKKEGNAKGLSGVNHIYSLKHRGLGNSSSLGCDAAVPVGAALASRRDGKGITISENGDATTSRGPVHEAMVLAASWKLPVLFVTQNNSFGISTDSRTTLPTINPSADRAAGYAMPSEVADGTDVLDVYEKCKKMMDYVRENGKPAILETHAYRWGGHFEGDQTLYRDKEEEAEMRKNDGLAKFGKYLVDEGLMTVEEQDELKAKLTHDIDEAVAYAEAAEAPTLDDVYDLMKVAEED